MFSLLAFELRELVLDLLEEQGELPSPVEPEKYEAVQVRQLLQLVDVVVDHLESGD